MAKKQQIILTHGAMAPTEQAIKDLKLGEVLVQHAADAKEAALHTILEEGNVEALVSFPSTAWVDQKIKDVNTAAGQLESTVSALQTQVDGIDAAYKAADAAMDAAYKAADTKIREDFAAADTVLEGQITALDARVEANEGAISGLQTTVSDMDAAYKAADTAIRGEFAAADTALEGRVDGKLAGKADKATVEALDGRVATNEGAIADLVAADTVLSAEIATKVSQEAYDKKVADIEKTIELLPTLDLKVVEVLPTEEEGINSKTLYLVKDKEDEGNLYTEYLYIDGKWENLGKHTVDLTDYYTSEQVDGFLAGKVDAVAGSRLMTDAEGQKLANIEAGAQVNVVDAVKVNGVEAVVEGKVASVEVEADDITLGTAITTDGTELKEDKSNLKYAATDKLSTVLQSIYTSIKAADAGGVKSVTAADNSVEVNSNDINNPTVKVKVNADPDNLLSVTDAGLFVAMYYDGDDAE